MKTKLIKVSVAEPSQFEHNKRYYFVNINGDINMDFFYNYVPFDEYTSRYTHFLEETPDYTDELQLVLSEIMRFKNELKRVMGKNLAYPDNFIKAIDDADNLLTKIEKK